MKFTVNMLLTCIIYCAPGPAAITTVCKYSRADSYHVTDVMFCTRTILLDTVALLRESYTFV